MLTANGSGWQEKLVSNIYHCRVERQKCCLRAELNKRCISQRKSCRALFLLCRRPFPISNRFRKQDQSVPERRDPDEETGGGVKVGAVEGESLSE